MEFHDCSLNLVDQQKDRVVLYIVDSEYRIDRKEAPIPSVIKSVIESGQYIYRPNRADASFGEDIPENIHSVIDIPFVGGTLAVNSTQENAFSERAIHIFEQFSQVMSEAHRRLQDISERKRHETEQAALGRIRDVMWEMKRSDEIDKLIATIKNELEALKVPFQGCSVNIVEDAGKFAIISHQTSSDSVWTKHGPDHSAEFLKQIWLKGAPFYRPDLSIDDPTQEKGQFDENYGYSVRSVIDIPFSQGTLALNSSQANAFSPEHIEFLQTIAGVLSEGFQRQEDLLSLVPCQA